MNLIGKTLQNRYEILEKIGSGGMATVYRARCHMLNRDVAVKVLKDEFTTDAEFIKRFNIEAQSAASLTHSNIVSIYDVGTEDNMYYIVMELIKGRTLKEIIQEKGKISWRLATDITKQVLSGLNTAHKNGVVHRDIKPHNIIITKDGAAKITDFGIAKATNMDTITAMGSTLGSVHYFSPEHAKGAKTDAQSDIYSTGIMLYEMVTGKVPFDGDTAVSVALKQVQEKPIPPIDRNMDLPKGLNQIILKAIEKDKKLRYFTAEEFYDDLCILEKEPDVDFKNLTDTFKKSITRIIPTIKEKDEQTEKGSKGLTKLQQILIYLAFVFAVIVLIIGISFGISAIKRARDPFLPNLTGEFNKKRLTKEEAIVEIQKIGLNYEIIEEYSDDIESGQIIKQEPRYQEGYRIPKGSKIKLHISKGAEKKKLPVNLVGKNIVDVKKQIEELGFKYEIIEEFNEDKDKEKGIVLKVEPEVKDGENEIPHNTVIKITVSKGSEKKEVEIPIIVGKNKNEVKKMLEALKLVYEEKEVVTAGFEEKGSVVSSTPEQGQKIKEGEKVTVYVSKPVEPVKGTITIDVNSYVPDDIKNDITKTDVNLTVKLNTRTIVNNQKVGKNEHYFQKEYEDMSPIQIEIIINGTSVKVHYNINVQDKPNITLNKNGVQQ